jgi:muramoyltetrapeptide carboxypeptidase
MTASFPKPLKKGDTIGIISPSSALNRDVFEKGVSFLEQNGYGVFVHPQNDLQRGQLAGRDKEKVAALTQLFINPAIDGIVCACGGNGAIRLLKHMDFELISKHPKTFVGYSDITILLQALLHQSGFVTFHGPMIGSFGRDFDPRTAIDFFAQIEARMDRLEVPEVEVLRAGRAEGILIGGNMTMLQNLISTPYDWDTQGVILFIEDVDEVLYRIDRMLQHFQLSGKFKHIKAVLVGEMLNTPDGETAHMRPGERPYGYTIEQILRENIPEDIPLCMNFPCGHGKYISTLPVGSKAQLTLDNRGASLVFSR